MKNFGTTRNPQDADVTLPQRDVAHDVHVVDLRKMQWTWDGCGHHHLCETDTHTHTDKLHNSHLKLDKKYFLMNYLQWWSPSE